MIQYLQIFFLAMIPTIEARFSIVFGISSYNIHPGIVFTLACLGTFVAILASILFLYKILPLIKWKWLQKLMDKVFSYTKRKHSKKLETFEDLSIISFIAIPFPGTGIYTGILISYLLGHSAKKTFIFSTIGMLISALLTTLGALGVISMF